MERTTQQLALRLPEAARALGVCTKTVWTWAKAGILPHVRIGRAILFPVAELEEWLRRQAARQQAQTAEQVEGQGNGNAL